MEPEEGGGVDSEGPAPSSDCDENFAPLAMEGEGPDPWARVEELPSALGDKMLELRSEK